MFTAKEKFLDRVEQSFKIFKENFVTLTIPLLIFNLLTIVAIPYIVGIFFLGMIDLDGIFGGDMSQLSLILTFVFTGALLFMILYFLFIIPIQLGILKTIQESFDGKSSTIGESFSYGFGRIGSAFRTYWYIFSYTLLMPALVFILGGILLNIGLYYNTSSTEIFSIIGGSLMGLSLFWGLFFLIYRGVKATFAMVSAVDTDSFTRENFFTAVGLTEGKWKRVFLNIFGIGFLGGLAIGLVGGLGESIAFFGNDWEAISQVESDEEELALMLRSFTDFNIFFFINSLIQTFLNTILGVFIMIFTYVMFKRLEFESANPSTVEEAPKKENGEQKEL